MNSDPILDELREVRENLVARFGGDLHKLIEHLVAEERRAGRSVVARPPRQSKVDQPSNKPRGTADAA